MAKFRKGDRVRIITLPHPQKYYVLGDTGTVAEDNSQVPWVQWDNNPHGNGRWAVDEDCLELIEHQPDRMAELEARVAELERALAAKQDAQPEPEFLEGRREHFDLLKDSRAFNHSDGSGIYVGRAYEAVIMPNPNNEGGTIIRFRRKQ